jgi:hypothetical protein
MWARVEYEYERHDYKLDESSNDMGTDRIPVKTSFLRIQKVVLCILQYSISKYFKNGEDSLY